MWRLPEIGDYTPFTLRAFRTRKAEHLRNLLPYWQAWRDFAQAEKTARHLGSNKHPRRRKLFRSKVTVHGDVDAFECKMKQWVRNFNDHM